MQDLPRHFLGATPISHISFSHASTQTKMCLVAKERKGPIGQVFDIRHFSWNKIAWLEFLHQWQFVWMKFLVFMKKSFHCMIWDCESSANRLADFKSAFRTQPHLKVPIFFPHNTSVTERINLLNNRFLIRNTTCRRAFKLLPECTLGCQFE